ncbi:MAG: hypothetical protein ACKVW3_14610 [Phycisphaerales bacterium]
MNRLIASKSHALCAVLALAAGTTTTASAVDKHWTSNINGSWSTASNWSPVGVPAAADNVNIGNVAGVQNTTVLLDVNETVFDIDITDGMTLDTNSRTLNVNFEIEVSGRNVVGNSVFPSRLRVDQIVNGPEVFTQILSVHNQGEVQLVGGGLSIDALFDIHAGSFLRGAGTVSIDSNFINFRNDGTIAPSGAMTFSQTGTGLYDLDGTSGGGDLDLTAASNSSLTFNGDGIFEAFGGTLSMIRGTLLHMNLNDGWTVEASGTFNIYGSGSGSPARVTGSPLNFNGTINLYGGSQFSLEADTTFGVNAELVTGLNAVADIAGDAVINGGLYTINEDSVLNFNGATTVHGGEFITYSHESTTGSVDFNGPTEWDGNVNFTGFVRQNGPARVAGPTIITGDTFDMDGSNAATWDIDAPLTMNVDRIDFFGAESTFNNTLDIGAGRLTVNIEDGQYWTIAGTANLSGNSLLFSTKIGDGSPVYLAGEVNVSGKNDIATGTIVASTSTINIAAATSALRFMASVLVGNAVTFTGTGTLQTGANSTMIINSGLNTNGVGLHNAGTLRVSSGPGTMSVDRFLTSGTWIVDIRGYNAVTEYDRLISNGPATLGGTLEVDLTDALGDTFRPNVGDQFTILNAVGGITGSFAPNVTTIVGPTTYHWEVIVSAADVVVRLASIAECYANCDGSGAAPALNVADFICFQNKFAAGSSYANCDNSTTPPVLNVADFICFMNKYSAGCP